MGNFDKHLEKISSVCARETFFDGEYSKFYTFTTENISEYMKYFDFQNKSLLTIGSSGDQILNSFYYGARDITLFDINEYSKYYIYLKIAAIISLNYKEFQYFFFRHGDNTYENDYMFSKRLYSKLIPVLRILDYESYLLFDELFALYDAKTIRVKLFDDDEDRNRVIRRFNVYLHDEESFNKLKSILKKISIKFIYGDIFKDDVPGKYDNIILSNLCTIVPLDDFYKLLTKIDENNLNDNGSMMLGYLWDINFDETTYRDDWKDIYKMPIVKEKLGKYLSESYQVLDAKDILWEQEKKRDLVLLYRKK